MADLNLTQSRRNFIKAAGATLFAGAAAAALGGCASKGKEENKNNFAQSIGEIDWDEETDVLIVGGGLAGQAAAATVATEGNGAKALLLEKGALVLGDGDSPFSAGRVLWTDDEHAEGFRQYLYELRGEMDNTPDAVLDAFAEGIHENRTWLESLPGFQDDYINATEHFHPGTGDTCYPEYAELPHGYNLGVLYFKDDTYNHVIKFVNSVFANDPNITHKLNAPLTALIQDPETKAVLGGVYTYEGKTVYVKANKGVIMCCGGFENNKQMRADYLSAATARCIAGRMNTGDGHYICSRIGADMWHMNSCAGMWTSVSPIEGEDVTMRTPKQFGITVAENGRRFFMDWDSDHEHDWEVIDQNPLNINVGSRHGHMQFGGEWPHLPMPAVTWLIVGAAGYQSILENKMMNITWDPMDGWGYSADTLEGLAETIGVPAEELVRSVEQWDECCANGEDVYFHRPASTLNPIGDGPYYALYCPPTMLNTDGGPRRSARGEILDLDGQPIPHLYSAGEFGSIWANMYQGAGNLGECLAFGRISARNCLGIA